MSGILDFIRRITGISTPLGGIQWNNEPAEREIVYELLQSLGNRRLISHYHRGFEYRAVLRSCELIREDITCALKKLQSESKARKYLEEMRLAIHIFQTLVEERYPSEKYSYEQGNAAAEVDNGIMTALRALRDYYGERLSLLSSVYGTSPAQELSHELLDQHDIIDVTIAETPLLAGYTNSELSSFPDFIPTSRDDITRNSSNSLGSIEIIKGESPMDNSTAYFRFTDTDGQPQFVIKLVEQSKIEHARRILRGEETARVQIQGTIVKTIAPYNPHWHYHLEPKSIDFFEMAMEVCDASIQYVEENLNEVGGSTLPNCHWCPWSSRLVDEVQF